MKSFTVNHKVMVRNYHPGPKWIPATIIRQLGPLSFRVRVKKWPGMERHMEQIQGYLPISEDISCSSSASTDDQLMIDMDALIHPIQFSPSIAPSMSTEEVQNESKGDQHSITVNCYPSRFHRPPDRHI